MNSKQEDWFPIIPGFTKGGTAYNLFISFVQELAKVSADEGSVTDTVHKLRLSILGQSSACDRESQVLRVCVSVLCDLRAQGWQFVIDGPDIRARKPTFEAESILAEKARVRAGLLLERDSQLRQPSTRNFITEMERKRKGPKGWASIFSLMRDGREVCQKLRKMRTLEREDQRVLGLKEVIDPYIQFVDDKAVCEFTGLRLMDIWRYFRHTWVNPYNSIPGRQMCILVRDRAAENHPVIGIAALGSAIVQLTPRDKWIGWTSSEFLANLVSNPKAKWAAWLEESLANLIAGIYIKDFIAEGVLPQSEIKNPNSETLARLLKEAEAAKEGHHLYPKAAEHKSAAATGGMSWERQAQTYLFRSKRAGMLARLLKARMNLKEAGFQLRNRKSLKTVLGEKKGRDAIKTILRHIKAAHVGVDILDITVCGAIAPYNPILGGKLVSMLLTSSEVVSEYKRRYASAQSVIASSMAGQVVRRKPNLVLLGTTSLYGVGSSQYNRLKIPADEVGGERGLCVSYELLGQSVGYGSFHFSKETVQEIGFLLAQGQRGRRVNSIFGEGVNPRFRKIRNGLDDAGLPSEDLLQHGAPRLIYGIALATNFREVLLGTAKRPRYILPKSSPKETSTKFAKFWTKRWLMRRIENEDVLQQVERHTLVHPICHGARITLQEI